VSVILRISRYRERPIVTTKGTFWWSFDGKTRSNECITGWVERCEDWVGGWDMDNPFLIDRRQYYPPLLSGEQWSSDGDRLLRKLDNYPPDLWSVGFNPPIADLGRPHTSDDYAAIANAGVAAMNPSRPAISVPTVLGESRDLPTLMRSIPDAIKNWRSLAGIAGANLAWQFGWKPMISDLKKCLDFEKSVSQRMTWLRRLREGKPIYRRYQLPKGYHLGDPVQIWTETFSCNLKQEYRDLSTKRAWVTSRWKAICPQLTIPKSDEAMRKRARDLTFGLTSPSLAEAAWELVPWSWLIDWFAGVGETLAVLNNSLLLQLDSLCYMQHLRMIRSFRTLSKSGWVSLSRPGTFVKVEKSRKDIKPYVMSSPLFSSTPVLSGRQMGILASVVTQRGPSSLVRKSIGGGKLRLFRAR
jgi:hypothetical protein